MHILKRLAPRSDNYLIFIILLANLLVGGFIFRDYGLSLDEPLYYAYGEAIGYAYDPIEWFSGDFVLTRAFGPSPADHGNRGPAYLLIARIPAKLLQHAGLDLASSWHLVNFIAFQIGLYFFYRLCLRWMTPWAAIGATLLLSTQPIIWEHAFINPKDPPFLSFFTISLELGFRMADKIRLLPSKDGAWTNLHIILLPAVMLGLTSNLRVIGPLVAVLVGLYLLSFRKFELLGWLIPYGIIAYAMMVLTWPYLWSNPIGKFFDVVRFMADNPTTLRVFFYGQLYPADDLPLRYLPTLMAFTLTETVWLLAVPGALVALAKIFRRSIDAPSLILTMGWFVIPFGYVLVKRPPMYDGFRHFLFIISPVFILAGILLDSIQRFIQHTCQKVLLISILLLPGLAADITLHPYQYTYYNTFVGGTGKAAFRFETDYWLTCYKEALEQLAPFSGEPVTLYVQREFYIAKYYATGKIEVQDLQKKNKTIQPGDFILWSSRANPSLQRYRDPTQVVLRVERDGALFCVTQRQ